ncbi:MAG: hypothetical protein HRT47_09925 [Candidatus Caenarcaniphilales bacterium]|nr:hypothetical protein [Candidatus Caenarcaniphilales bacterium]
MKNSILFIICISFFALLLPAEALKISNDHKCVKLGVLTSPAPIKIGSEFDLKLQAVVKSETGVETDRLKVYLADRLISEANDFQVEAVNNPEKPNLYRVSFDKNSVMVNNEDELKIRLNLLESDSRSVLTSRAKKIRIGEKKKFVALDDFSFAPKLVKLRARVIDAKSEKEIKASVGQAPIKFKVTIEHDPDYVGAETLKSFSARDSVLLNNLRVYKYAVDGSKLDVTNEFKFKLFKDSSNKFAEFDTLLSHFVSQSMTIKDFEVYKFAIDLRPYFDEVIKQYPRNARLKANSVISFKAMKAEIANLNLNAKEIIFTLDSSEEKARYISDEVVLNADYDKDKYKVKEIRSFKTNLNDYKNFALKPLKSSLLGLSSGKAVKFSVLQDSSEIKLDDGKLSIPLFMKLKQKRNFFIKNKELYNNTLVKKLNLDFALVFKAENGLDYLIRSDIEKNVSLKFIDSPKFRKADKASADLVATEGSNPYLDLKFKYSNTVDKTTDPMNLHLILADSNSVAIPDAICSYENFSQLTSNSKGSFSEKVGSAKCPAAFVSGLKQASKIKLVLERDSEYIKALKLDPQNYPILLEKDFMVLTINKNVK